MTAQNTQISPKKYIRTCSIWRALEVIGDTPTLLILEAIWLGERRFDGICKKSGQLKALTSDRLKKMIAAGILQTKQYSEKPPRNEYRMTQKGADLYWLTLMLLRWEKKWSQGKKNFDVKLIHKTCGNEMEPEPLCGHCSQIIQAKDVDWEEGPGVGLMAPTHSRRRARRGGGDEENRSLFTDSAEIMGDRWSGLIIRSIFTKLRKYDEILNDTGMATNILAERLAWLTQKGMITAVLYQNNPERFEYWLTRKGLDYYPVLVMLQLWGDKYYASPEGPPIILEHKVCGQPLNAYVGCSCCKKPIDINDVEFEIVRNNG